MEKYGKLSSYCYQIPTLSVPLAHLIQFSDYYVFGTYDYFYSSPVKQHYWWGPLQKDCCWCCSVSVPRYQTRYSAVCQCPRKVWERCDQTENLPREVGEMELLDFWNRSKGLKLNKNILLARQTCILQFHFKFSRTQLFIAFIIRIRKPDHRAVLHKTHTITETFLKSGFKTITLQVSIPSSE